MDGLSRFASQNFACESPVGNSEALVDRACAAQEYAGLPGSSESVNFLKSTAQSQLSRALTPGSGWVGTLASRQMHVLTDNAPPLALFDILAYNDADPAKRLAHSDATAGSDLPRRTQQHTRLEDWRNWSEGRL